MSVRAVLFDLGGVILRTEYQAPRERLAERLNLTYEDLSKIVFDGESSRKASVGAASVEEHWKAVTRRLGRPTAEASQIRDEFFAGDILDRDLLGFIQSLRPRYKTGLITNAWSDLRDYVRKNELEGFFDVLIISAEVGVMKPDPKIFKLALEQLKIQAGEAVFIDDMLENVESARSIGLRGIRFREKGPTLAELKELIE